jgi:hypothetical protein
VIKPGKLIAEAGPAYSEGNAAIHRATREFNTENRHFDSFWFVAQK